MVKTWDSSSRTSETALDSDAVPSVFGGSTLSSSLTNGLRGPPADSAAFDDATPPPGEGVGFYGAQFVSLAMQLFLHRCVRVAGG